MRKAALFSALSFLGLFHGPALGWFGSDGGPIVVLWIPTEPWTGGAALDAALKSNENMKLTVALSAETLGPELERLLLPHVQSGRLEVALRLRGDPILPLIAEHPAAPRPHDAAHRIASARERHRLVFGANPAGFAPGGGALSPGLRASLKGFGLGWIGVGEYAGSTVAWAAADGTSFVPLRAVQTLGGELRPEHLSLPSYPEPVAFVVDEAELGPAGSMARLLEALSDGARPKQGWATVGEAARMRERRGARADESWPTWTGGTELWTSSPRSQRAWKLYGEAARALESYQNSGAAELKALDAASDELYHAQSSRYFRANEGAEGAALDREFRAKLATMFRRLRQVPPESLFKPMKASDELEPEPRGSGIVRFTQGANWIAFDNPAGSLSRAPSGLPALEDGRPASELWRIERLTVEWTEQALNLVYRMARIGDGGPPGAKAPELGALLIDTYIDLNGVVGAGSALTLEGRGGFLPSRDAWEYALVVGAFGAALYRSNPLGRSIEAGRAPVSVELESRSIRVAVPRSLLRGNPLRWGYAVSASALDPESTSKLPRPLKPEGGSALLALLGPIDTQKAAASSPKPRLPALRAPNR